MTTTRSSEVQKRASANSKVLAGKVAVITGASSGIGVATAWELARRGAIVVLAARREAELLARTNEITAAGYCAVALPTDVTDPVQVTRLVERIVEMFGRVDVLVNNAGIVWLDSFTEYSVEMITQMVKVNLLGTLLATHAVLPGMLERHHGAVIFVASVGGHIAIDPLYSATKFGMRGFSLSLRRQLVKSGVSVSLVSPGFVATAMTKNFRLHMPGPEVVGKVIANLVVHPRREVVVPGFYYGLIGVEHLFPWIADHVIRWVRTRIVPAK